ncbi:MAG: tetratricopeptide repeat protein [Vicinamibacterales bacterium]
MQFSAQFWLLATLLALLAGIFSGKAWERYKLRDGRWLDRRRLRDTPHYMLGLHFLVAGRIDDAIDELTQAASTEPDALEVQMILGNLFREKGQVTRAINTHQSLLQRAGLRPIEHAHILLCLGLDFRRGGFVDRAAEAFREVLTLDPANRHALVNLQKLHEDQHQWEDAAAARRQIAQIDGASRPGNLEILAFLENEIGEAHLQAGADGPALQAFERAIDIDARTAPAYLNLGDVRRRRGDLRPAIAAWEALAAAVPERAHLVFDRLESAWREDGTPGRFPAFCRALIDAHPQDWRARLALAGHDLDAGRTVEAFETLMDALPHHPHGMRVHQAIWQVLATVGFDPALVARYVVLAREAVFYLDPHVCTRCRYRSTELLWQCPQCHEWNTFVEERAGQARGALSE